MDPKAFVEETFEEDLARQEYENQQLDESMEHALDEEPESMRDG